LSERQWRTKPVHDLASSGVATPRGPVRQRQSTPQLANRGQPPVKSFGAPPPEMRPFCSEHSQGVSLRLDRLNWHVASESEPGCARSVQASRAQSAPGTLRARNGQRTSYTRRAARCRVRFGQAEVFEVASYKEETKSMSANYHTTECESCGERLHRARSWTDRRRVVRVDTVTWLCTSCLDATGCGHCAIGDRSPVPVRPSPAPLRDSLAWQQPQEQQPTTPQIGRAAEAGGAAVPASKVSRSHSSRSRPPTTVAAQQEQQQLSLDSGAEPGNLRSSAWRDQSAASKHSLGPVVSQWLYVVACGTQVVAL